MNHSAPCDYRPCVDLVCDLVTCFELLSKRRQHPQYLVRQALAPLKTCDVLFSVVGFRSLMKMNSLYVGDLYNVSSAGVVMIFED